MEQLEKYFDTAFGAPDGVKKLRELILTLAMQGKLVPQNSVDKPTSEVLQSIKLKHKEKYAEITKSNKKSGSVNQESIPYDIPFNWKWVTLSEIGEINPRNTADENLDAGFVPMPLIKAKYGVSHSFEARKWKLIRSGYTHFSNGDIGLAKITPCFENAKSCVFNNLPNGLGAGTTELHIFRNTFELVQPEFLLAYFKSPKFISDGINKMTGSAGQKRVPTEYFSTNPLPLPPFKEQQRIVKKIDQLMSRCDDLEKLSNERDQKRLTVHTAAIRKLLDAPDQATFDDAWQFITRYFGDLYTVRENVAELRKAILQLAVMGKLVPQDPKEGTARDIIYSNKNLDQTRSRGQHVTNKIDQKISTEVSMPFPIPVNWQWLKLGDLITSIDAGWSPACETVPANHEEWGVLKTTAVQSLAFWPHENKALPKKLTPRPDIVTEEGDILITRAGPKNRVGICCVAKSVPPKLMLSDKIIRIRIDKNILDLDYCALSLTIGTGADQIELFKSGMAESQMNISQDKIKKIIIAVPPLKVQKQIVKEIERLSNFCDTLEQQIELAFQKQAEVLKVVITH